MRLARILKPFAHRVLGVGIGVLMTPGTVWEPWNFRYWAKRGFFVTPKHFYFPIPDLADLAEHYPISSACTSIDLRVDEQVKLIHEYFRCYRGDFYEALAHQDDDQKYMLENDSFTGLDAFCYYSMIRHFCPRRIIEIGSGRSTLVALAALEDIARTQYTVIDPYPSEMIKGKSDRISIIDQRVEMAGLDYLNDMGDNDIIFIDNSHVVRTGGDVVWTVLEILPRLAAGALVHVHDIFLPYEYPRKILLEERRFFTEQYLLQAYLTENPHVEVLLSTNQLAHDRPDVIREFAPELLRRGGASFWFRKV